MITWLPTLGMTDLLPLQLPLYYKYPKSYGSPLRAAPISESRLEDNISRKILLLINQWFIMKLYYYYAIYYYY